MCGIFGEFFFKKNINIDSSIKNLDLLNHRGPDGFGFENGNFMNGDYEIAHNQVPYENKVNNSNYFLGHRRLSIVDLNDNAFQPMESKNSECSIVFNGEIYNFVELKKELLNVGCVFKTDHSDTEVLLNAYLVWGVKCLDKLRGMFAFALFDKKNNKVFLARDRIGQKTLYYEFSEQGFAFSSELMPLLGEKQKSRKINTIALSCYMAFGYIPSPYSIFDAINKLPPATYALLDLKNKTISLDKYWEITVKENEEKTLNQFITLSEELITESVMFRLRSDVNMGAFISGGIDSTLIVKKIYELGHKNFNIFGADFPNTDRSEKEYIEKAAARYKQNLILSVIDLSHAKKINDIIKVFDEPFDGGSSIALFDLFKNASKGHKVILTGDGGDEMFAGYFRYNEFPKLQEWFNKLKQLFIPKLILKTLINLGIKNRKISKLLKFIDGDYISGFIRYYHDLGLLKLVKNGVNEEDLLNIDLFKSIKADIDRFGLSTIKALQYFEINTILPGRMLYKLDRFSMFYSVEARSPLLDHKLVEMAFSIPDKFNISGNKSKSILKKILERDFDYEFVHRKKQGFGNPLSNWFKKVPPEEIFGLLLDKNSTIFNYLDFNRLHNSFPQITKGYNGTKEKDLWRLIVLAQYLENVKQFIRLI